MSISKLKIFIDIKIENFINIKIEKRVEINFPKMQLSLHLSHFPCKHYANFYITLENLKFSSLHFILSLSQKKQKFIIKRIFNYNLYLNIQFTVFYVY